MLRRRLTHVGEVAVGAQLLAPTPRDVLVVKRRAEREIMKRGRRTLLTWTGVHLDGVFKRPRYRQPCTFAFYRTACPRRIL